MKGKVTLLIIIIAAVALALIVRGEQDMTPPVEREREEVPSSTDTEEEVLVTYTDEGFSPSAVTVSQGTKVVFVNESSGSMWVGSDPHPVHTDLPAFDQLEGSGPGTSYEFTFREAGEWEYHNHLRPAHGGAVIVE